jgi:serine/threonine protein kinase
LTPAISRAYRTHTRWRPALRRHLGALLASAAGPSAPWPPPPGLAAALDVLSSILSGLPAHTAGPLSHAVAHHRLLLTDLLLPLYRIPGMVPLEHPPRCALGLVAVPLNACVSALVTRIPAWAPPAVDAVIAGWPPAAQASAAKGELLLGAVESIISAVAPVDASAADDAILAALPAVSVALQDQHAGVAGRAAALCSSQAVRGAACGGTRAAAAILRALVPALIGDATPHWSADVNRARHAALTALQKAQPEAFEAAAAQACSSAAGQHAQASPEVAHLLLRLRPESADASGVQTAADALEAVSLAPQPEPLSDSVGSTDLIFERLLGSGSFSTVHAARVRRPGVPASQWRHVAVKRVSGATLTASRYVTACAREVAALRAVTHPGVARLVTAFRWHGDVCMVLELATGGDLQGAIAARGRLPVLNTAFLTGELVAALGAVHDAGLAFGDLKPENVLLTASGHAKLTDFGAARPLPGSATGHQAAGRAASRAILAQLRRGDWRSQAGLPPKAGEGDADDGNADDDSDGEDDRLEGTTAYLAPELLAGHAPSVGTDAWALGCLVALCLTGALPIWCADPEALMQRIAAWTGDTGPLFSQHLEQVPSTAMDFVTSLLDPVPATRLGSDATSPGGMCACEQHEWLVQTLPCECSQLFSAAPPPLPPAAVGSGSRGPGVAALPRQNSVLYSRRGGGAGGITMGGGTASQDWRTGGPIPESEMETAASWAPRAAPQGTAARPPSALRRTDLGGINE